MRTPQARVAYVADGDEAGRDHVDNQLTPGGVLDEQIVFLGGEGSDLTLEDLVDLDVFIDVVNEHLKTQPGELEIPAAVIPATGRMRTVAEWCDAQSVPGERIAPPSKPGVAKALLQRKGERIYSADHGETLQQLDEQLREILDTATARLRGG